MSKKILLALFIVSTAGSSFAQTKLPMLTFSKIENLKDYISYNYKLEADVLDTLCLYTTVFVKFNISQQGQVVDLRFTKGTPTFILRALKKAIESSNGHWEIDKDEFHLCTTNFILPVVLFYGAGCKESEGVLGLSTDVALEKKRRDYFKLDRTLRESNYAVLNILNFDDGGKYLDNLKCTILSPISFSTNKD